MLNSSKNQSFNYFSAHGDLFAQRFIFRDIPKRQAETTADPSLSTDKVDGNNSRPSPETKAKLTVKAAERALHIDYASGIKWKGGDVLGGLAEPGEVEMTRIEAMQKFQEMLAAIPDKFKPSKAMINYNYLLIDNAQNDVDRVHVLRAFAGLIRARMTAVKKKQKPRTNKPDYAGSAVPTNEQSAEEEEEEDAVERAPDDDEVSDDLLRRAADEIAKNLSVDEDLFRKHENIFPGGVRMDSWTMDQGMAVRELEEEGKFGTRIIDDSGILIMDIAKGSNMNYAEVVPNSDDGTVDLYIAGLEPLMLSASGIEPEQVSQLIPEYDFYLKWYKEEASKLFETYGDSDDINQRIDALRTWFVGIMTPEFKRFGGEISVDRMRLGGTY
jgi:hypothetical protein